MKPLARLAAVAAVALSVPIAGAATKDSFISAFAGPHNGTLAFFGATGNTFGSFKASKKKEIGTVTLQSALVAGNASVGINERLSFNKRSVTWTLVETLPDGTSLAASGVGTATIKKNSISYTVPINISGTSGLLVGTMSLAKNHHLTVQETVSSGGSGSLLLYQLGGKKPKK